jgi:hypothetical protein
LIVKREAGDKRARVDQKDLLRPFQVWHANVPSFGMSFSEPQHQSKCIKINDYMISMTCCPTLNCKYFPWFVSSIFHHLYCLFLLRLYFGIIWMHLIIPLEI